MITVKSAVSKNSRAAIRYVKNPSAYNLNAAVETSLVKLNYVFFLFSPLYLAWHHFQVNANAKYIVNMPCRKISF